MTELHDPTWTAALDGAGETTSRRHDEERVRELMPALEALLFGAAEPLSMDDLRALLPEEERVVAPEAMERLQAEYRQDGRGLQIIRVAGGFRMTTRAHYERYLRALHRQRNRFRLGRAALETLSIVAYRQPITAPEIAEIRGRDSSSTLHTLMEHGLVRTRGRRKVVGKPFLYGTTRDFLVHFGLDALDELPSLEEFSAMIGDLPDLDEPGEAGDRLPPALAPTEPAGGAKE